MKKEQKILMLTGLISQLRTIIGKINADETLTEAEFKEVELCDNLYQFFKIYKEITNDNKQQ